MNSDRQRRDAKDALRLLEDWVSALREAPGDEFDRTAVPPFEAMISPTDAPDALNVAAPVYAGAPDIAGAVDELRRLFRERRRELRIEFPELQWPGLAETLEALGLNLDDRRPLMACWRERLRRENAPGVTVLVLSRDSGDDTLAAFQSLRWGEEAQTRAGTHVADLRARLEAARGVYALANADGEPAGTAVIHPFGSVAEMVGVHTAPSVRGRGVAGTLCSFLCEWHFDRGGELVWLDAADERARRLYARLGFDDIGDWLEFVDAPGRS